MEVRKLREWNEKETRELIDGEMFRMDAPLR